MADAHTPEPAFNRRLGFGERPAVLIVDMCRAYFTPGSPLDLGSPAAIDGCVALVNAARLSHTPVLWTRVEFEPGGDGGVFYRKVGALASFDRGNPLAGWLDTLTPADGDVVITKQGASAFFATTLMAELERQSIDTVIIGGVSTSGCVRATAVDACQHNVVPVVVPEACGDREPEIHSASLFDIDAKYGDVIALDEVLARLGS
ncbi:MAG: isochorismatase family protein [Actinomycetota bacterium]